MHYDRVLRFTSLLIALCVLSPKQPAKANSSQDLSELLLPRGIFIQQQHLEADPQPDFLDDEDSFLPEVIYLALDLSERRLYLYRNATIIESYSVAVGREDWQTPIGEFRVINMQVNPYWQHPFTGVIVPPGPTNPLGNRWIGFWSDGLNSIGLHGTTDESLIGQAVSHGCVRMRNEDIISLYRKVDIGTPIFIRP